MVTGKRRSSRFSGEWRTYFLGHLIAPRKERVMPEDVPCSKCIELEHIQQITGKIIGACVSGNQKSLKSVFYRGDILFGKLRPYLRKYALTHFSGVCSTEIWVFNSISKAITLNQFAYYLLQSDWFIAAANSTIGTKMPRADWSQLRYLKVKIPSSVKEQTAIAEVLSDADCLIVSLQKLIAKKKAIKQGAMQELLTGKRRLPGFSGEWKTKKIKEIAHVCSEKNAAHEKLNVLTCSKHFGFVDSLSYFKNQVFSKDTSGYKVIYKNQIGYPANHIEEGAIGLQNLYEKALVSPIYIVFSVTDSVDSFFLHRLLKLDCYKNIFATETCSSVDRRGSLRWPAFSEVEVSLPDIVEQREVAKVLSDMDTEIEKLEKKLSEYQKIKQGMMQELLTGRIRLINAEPKQEQQVTKSVERQPAVR